MSQLRTTPSRSIAISTTIAARSLSGLSDVRSVDSDSGSIGKMRAAVDRRRVLQRVLVDGRVAGHQHVHVRNRDHQTVHAVLALAADFELIEVT